MMAPVARWAEMGGDQVSVRQCKKEHGRFKHAAGDRTLLGAPLAQQVLFWVPVIGEPAKLCTRLAMDSSGAEPGVC